MVFGVIPRIPIRPQQLPNRVTRIIALKKALKTVKLVARSRLVSAITSNVLAAADNNIKIGDDAPMSSEKPTAKWTGLFAVVKSDGKTLTVDSGDKTRAAFMDKGNRYTEHELGSGNGHPINVAGDQQIDTIPAEDITSALDAILNPSNDTDNDENGLSVDEFLVKIISDDDSRTNIPNF